MGCAKLVYLRQWRMVAGDFQLAFLCAHLATSISSIVTAALPGFRTALGILSTPRKAAQGWVLRESEPQRTSVGMTSLLGDRGVGLGVEGCGFLAFEGGSGGGSLLGEGVGQGAVGVGIAGVGSHGLFQLHKGFGDFALLEQLRAAVEVKF